MLHQKIAREYFKKAWDYLIPLPIEINHGNVEYVVKAIATALVNEAILTKLEVGHTTNFLSQVELYLNSEEFSIIEK